MISANVQQQQQQVDNKKATNANYNRKSQINLAQYTQSSHNRNILNENNYYITKDYNSAVDLAGNQLLSPQTTSASVASNPSAPLSIASNILSVDSTSSTNILNEQISALFPKCRPKNDANLNKTSLYIETNNTALASASLLLASSPSNGDYKNQNKLFSDSESPENTLIDNSRAYTRNMNNQNADASLNDGGSELMQNNIGGIGETASRMNHAGYAKRSNYHNPFYQVVMFHFQMASRDKWNSLFFFNFLQCISTIAIVIINAMRIINTKATSTLVVLRVPIRCQRCIQNGRTRRMIFENGRKMRIFCATEIFGRKEDALRIRRPQARF